jgi:hypothetical protein
MSRHLAAKYPCCNMSLGEPNCDVAWDEDEGDASDDSAATAAAADLIAELQDLASKLSLEDFTTDSSSMTHVTVSNVKESAPPELRYVVYTPFLNQPGLDVKLEQVAQAFTQELTSNLSKSQTFYLDFYKPEDASLSSMFAHYKNLEDPEGQLGILMTSEETLDSEKPIRTLPTAWWELEGVDPYRTFIVFIEGADFIQQKGKVLFLLTDGGRVHAAEPEDYIEVHVVRIVDMGEVTRRLEDP